MTQSTETDSSRNTVQRYAKRALDRPESTYRVLRYVVLAFFLITSLFPFYWLFVIAITPNQSIVDMGLLPKGFHLSVFIDVFQQVPFLRFMLNSVIIATMTTIIVLFVGSIAGYVFGRYDFPGRTPLMLVVLVVSYFPGVAFLIPLFQLFTANLSFLGVQSPMLYNTPWSVVMPLSALTMPLIIFLLSTFYGQIPDGLEDAARVEGSTRLGALFRVIIPLSAPGFATAGILCFIIVYNEFFFSFLMVSGSATEWAPVLHGIFLFQGSQAVAYDMMAAASILGVVPMAIIVMVAQDRIVSGLTQGGLKE